jgi:hypothetical protein
MKYKISVFILFGLIIAPVAFAQPVVYSGKLIVDKMSGGTCSDTTPKDGKDIELGFERDSQGLIRGWFTGDVMTGTFSGVDFGKLAVEYPFFEQGPYTQSHLSLRLEGDQLLGDLSDHPLDKSVPQCNYDHALLQMTSKDIDWSSWHDKAEKLFTVSKLRSESQHWLRQGYWPQAISLCEEALELLKSTGIENILCITILNDLAYYYEKGGRMDVAESMYRQALEFSERVLGENHEATSTCLNNLGLFYRQQHNYEAAEPLYRRALSISEQYLGAEHPDTAILLSNLAMLCRALGNLAEAKELQKRALQIKLKHMGIEGELTEIEG